MHVLIVLMVAWLADGRVALTEFPYPQQDATQAECQADVDGAAGKIIDAEQGKYLDVRATCVALDLVKKTGA